MAPDPRIKKACNAMKLLGIQESKVRPVLRKLRKAYDNNWDFIEDDNYKVLLDAILDEDDPQATEKKKEAKQESKDVAMNRGKKKAQTQLVVQDVEDDIGEDEAPLKKRLRRKRETGCDNSTSLSLGSPSKKPIKEDRKQTQLALINEDGEDVNNTSLSLVRPTSMKPNEENHKPEEEDNDEMTELPPLKRYLRRTGEKGSATVDNNTIRISMEPEELPVMLLLAGPIVAENDHLSENCSAPVLEMVKSNMHVEEQDGETDVILSDSIPIDVPPSETVPDMMIKAGDESGAADNSMGLVVVPECDVSADVWRANSNIRDITVGQENIEIPWMNGINHEVPSRFGCIPRSYVFQDAAVKFSVSSFSDDQCCFSCIGDCLDSSSMPCNCTTAYTVDGVLREDFLEARISEARDQRKQVLQFCQECPLEKAKKEEILEPCKGHIKRKAIKECWIKCGCAKRCGNRLVQRGIHNKLEVFFTSNGKGWGLRTLERMPQGAFVCEYIGEILTISELYQRNLEDKVTSPVILDAHWGSEESLEDSKALCLDGTRYGNVSRFLNHRCLDANLIEIPVHVESPDRHYYHLAFFTTRVIEPMEELTWDYGVDFNDEDCLIKFFDCECGSRFCRNIKRLKKAKKVRNRA